MVKYVLRSNPFTKGADSCIAQVVDAVSYSKDDIISEMARRGTTATRTDIVAILTLFTEVCSDIISEGGSVNTDLFNTSMSVAGAFKDENAAVKDSAIRLNMFPGTALKAAAAKARAVKAEAASTDPVIASAGDSVRGTADSVKAGSAMELIGSRLKFDKTDEAQGVFVTQGTKTFRCSKVIENKPSRVVVLLPEGVSAGDFTVQVRTKLDSSNRTGKTVKKGAYKKPVTAVAQ